MTLMSAMNSNLPDHLEQAQAVLVQRIGGNGSPDTAANLLNGLFNLRRLLLIRLHSDIKSEFDIDSALAPAAADGRREMGSAAEEIEAYSLILVIDEATRRGYAKGDANWFRNWLLGLRFGDQIDAAVVLRMQTYDKLSTGQRRRLFSSSLEQALGEARNAPLIIYRLFPRAVRIATALAFGDAQRAREIRAEQIAFLPVIAYCHQCHGLPLENGETCAQCGNPIWKVTWLNATD